MKSLKEIIEEVEVYDKLIEGVRAKIDIASLRGNLKLVARLRRCEDKYVQKRSELSMMRNVFNFARRRAHAIQASMPLFSFGCGKHITCDDALTDAKNTAM